MPLITYEPDRTIDESDTSLTILETSLKHNIPHIHACGGKARCSTCRILVTKNPHNLSEPTQAEQELAKKRGFEAGVRLACQTHARGPVSIRVLVQDDSDVEEIRLREQTTTGREDKLAILFSDIRNFTSFSERHLPYDIIHILNRYFEAMGQIVLDYKGMLNQYMGDGMMASFGLNDSDSGCDVTSVCIRSVAAALDMTKALVGINEYARRHLDHQFEIGIGIHFGSVIVGELGHHSNATLTLIGDAVNLASRIESVTKKAGTPLLVSETVYKSIQNYATKGRVFRATVKGKTGTFRLYEIKAVDRKAVSRYL